jgi:hypothetical protein
MVMNKHSEVLGVGVLSVATVDVKASRSSDGAGKEGDDAAHFVNHG